MYVVSVWEVGTTFYFFIKVQYPNGDSRQMEKTVTLKGRNSGGPVENVAAEVIRQTVQAIRGLRDGHDQRLIQQNLCLVQIEETP